MKGIGKIWLPAICAILILLITGIVDLFGFIPVQQRDKFEFLSNGALFAVAVLGLFLRKPASGSGGGRSVNEKDINPPSEMGDRLHRLPPVRKTTEKLLGHVNPNGIRSCY